VLHHSLYIFVVDSYEQDNESIKNNKPGFGLVEEKMAILPLGHRGVVGIHYRVFAWRK